MFHDEFYYRAKFNPFFRSLSMKFEEGGGGEGEGNQGGGNGEHFTDNYESLKGNEVLKRYKTEEDAHRGHLETKKDLIEKTTALSNPLRLPKALPSDITPEQMSDYRAGVGKLLGAPDTEDGYEIVRPQLPEGMPYDEEGEKLVRAWGVKHHLPQAAVREALDLWNGSMVKRSEAQTKTNTEAVEATTKQLKELLKDDYDSGVILAEQYLRSRVNPEWRNVKEEDDTDWQKFRKEVYLTGIGNNFTLMSIVIEQAKAALGEGKVFGGANQLGGVKGRKYAKSPGMYKD